MASNSTTLADEDGDYEDWIEIYNSGNEAINLEGIGLSDDYDTPFRWVFPDTTLQPGGFILVWASGKNRAVPGQPLHTNFSISAVGEEVLLTSWDGERIDELQPTEIQTDISIGRYPDGTGNWVFYIEPSPGAANHSDFFSDHLAPPEFSHHAGYYPGGLILELSHPENNVEIRYTLDGSEPDASSTLYNGAIDLSGEIENELMFIQTTPDEGADRGYAWKEPPASIPGAHVVRAIAMKPGYLSSEITNRTFLNSEPEHSLPVISITTDQNNLFNDTTGIYVPGIIYEELGWPPHDYWGRPNANYHQRGIEWERPAGFELIEKDGRYHHQNIGLRIHGGGSRALPQKSLRLYARSSYGDSRFNYDMFGDGETGYNRLILRNSGQDFYSSATMFMDAFMHTIVSNLSFDTMKYRPFAIYLNGEYWGVKNLRERYDKHYIERNYGVEEEYLDLLSNNSVVKEGSAETYDAVLDSLEQFSINDLGGVDFIERHIDVQNFTEYYASQIFFNNVDWPGNNYEYWRYTGPPENRGRAKDGRFRWLMFDLDFGMGYLSRSGYDDDIFDHLLSEQQTNWANHPRTTLMFRTFLQNREFLEYYANVQMDLLNSYAATGHTQSVLNEFRDLLSDEILRHIERWGYPADMNRWERNIDRRLEFLAERPAYLVEQIQSRFNIGETSEIFVDNHDPGKGTVQVNTLKLTEDLPWAGTEFFPWTGEYFTQIPVKLTAHPKPGFRFENWMVNGEFFSDPQISITPEDSLMISAYFTDIPDPADQDKELIYYWHFDEELPNDTPLTVTPSTFSATDHYAFIRYQPAISPYPPGHDDTAGIMDRVNDPTEVNYREEGNSNLPYSEDEMRGIRVRNPSVSIKDGDIHESAIIFDLPTSDHEGLAITFAAKRTTSGQQQMVFHYSVNEGEPNWIQHQLPVTVVDTPLDYRTFIIDFTNFERIADNPDFRFRISFEGDHLGGDSGNTRFNNIAVFGSRFSGVKVEDIEKSKLHPNYPNPFNNQTTINYQVNRESDVAIDLFNITGQRIARLVDEKKERGIHSIQFNGSSLASGVYILRLLAGGETDHQKITFIK